MYTSRHISITDLRLDLGNPDPDSRGSVSIRQQAGDTTHSLVNIYKIRNIYQQYLQHSEYLQHSFVYILTMGLTHRKQRQGRKKTVKTRSFSPLHILLGWMIKGKVLDDQRYAGRWLWDPPHPLMMTTNVIFRT